ncbi:MAG TPA: hypothetical protein VGM88_14430 [Kofleriaceae bacterium]|jgi:hypothetical protein
MTRLAGDPSILGLAALLLAAACKRHDEPAPPAPPAEIGSAEIARDTDACTAYVTKLCACAAKDPSLASQCELAHGLPEAVTLASQASQPGDGSASARDLHETARAVRRLAAKCIEDTAKLHCD